MSAGHLRDGDPVGEIAREAALAAIADVLKRKRTIDRGHDLPYLAGYSRDGKIIFIDRHLPEKLKIGSKEVDVSRFLETHEEVEKALIDELGWGYARSHNVATWAENRAVRAAGISPHAYERVLKPYIKADEHEKLIKVPPALDLTPYYAPPVDKALVAHLRKRMGLPTERESKAEAGYKAGMKAEHCGPDGEFGPVGSCLNFQPPHGCERVRGLIDPDMWCHYFERKKG